MLESLPRVESEDRTKYIGASRVAAILGLSPYQTPMGVWMDMTNPEPRADTPATERGRFLERGILEWGGHKLGAQRVEYGAPISEPGIAIPDAPWASVHPDGAYLVDGRWRLGEVKTSRVAHAWGDNGTDQVPDWYLCQVQMQLAAVPDAEDAVVAAYLPVQDQLLMMPVARDDEFQRFMIDTVGDWYYRHIILGEAPSLDASDATKRYLSNKFAREMAPLRDASADEVALLEQWKLARAALAAAEEQETMLKHQVQALIGEAEGLRWDGGKATWKWQAGAARWDTKALEAAHPELVAQFKKRGDDLRVLRFAKK